MKSKSILFIILVILITATTAWFAGYKFKLFQEHKETKVSTVLESITQIMKLATVEGAVSEIYDYKSYNTYDISPFRKKILIRVNAKVLIGYDLEKAEIKANEKTKEVIIRNFPQPEVLSIEHDLDYYDMQEGTFNKFSEEELTELNKNAKEYAASKAVSDELFRSAEQQKDTMINMLNELLGVAGWTIVVHQTKPLLQG